MLTFACRMLQASCQSDHMMAPVLVDINDPACQPRIIQLFTALGDALIVVCKEVSRRRALCHAVGVAPRRDGVVLAPGTPRGKALRLLGPSVKIHVTDTFVEVFQVFMHTTVNFLVEVATQMVLPRPRLSASSRRTEFSAQAGPCVDAVATVIRKLMLASPTKVSIANVPTQGVCVCALTPVLTGAVSPPSSCWRCCDLNHLLVPLPPPSCAPLPVVGAEHGVGSAGSARRCFELGAVRHGRP
jgi:hypothetical protein